MGESHHMTLQCELSLTYHNKGQIIWCFKRISVLILTWRTIKGLLRSFSVFLFLHIGRQKFSINKSLTHSSCKYKMSFIWTLVVFTARKSRRNHGRVERRNGWPSVIETCKGRSCIDWTGHYGDELSLSWVWSLAACVSLCNSDLSLWLPGTSHAHLRPILSPSLKYASYQRFACLSTLSAINIVWFGGRNFIALPPNLI